MKSRTLLLGTVLTALGTVLALVPANAGTADALRVMHVHGKVEVRELKNGKPVGHWRRVKSGEWFGNHLVRTGPHSWARLGTYRPQRCLDANSLIRIERESILVYRGQTSAVDGQRGNRLPDGLL